MESLSLDSIDEVAGGDGIARPDVGSRSRQSQSHRRGLQSPDDQYPQPQYPQPQYQQIDATSLANPE